MFSYSKRVPSATKRLRGVAPFLRCTDQQLACIAANSSPVDVAAGTVLCRKGDTGDEVFVILSGEASVDVSDGTSVVVGHGAIVGELGVLDGGPRTATVVANEPM